MQENPSPQTTLTPKPTQLAEQLAFYCLDDVTPIVEYLEQFRLLHSVSLQNRDALMVSAQTEVEQI